MTVILKNGPFDGELVSRLPEHTSSCWMRRPGQDVRYMDSGMTDATTGYPIFVYALLRQLDEQRNAASGGQVNRERRIAAGSRH
jgi:hypothetical protein